MSLVTMSQHFGLLWVAIEATTLTSAPLIYFHRHHRSLEATWKYLLICSVGIALALLGNFFLAASAAVNGSATDLTFNSMLSLAVTLHPAWLKAAFLFLLVGYGTKMGLAPLHTWLPDAHSESPSVVSALLSGALLNCAFLGLLRVYILLQRAGWGDYARTYFLGFGLFSLVVAVVFILGQPDYKRLLAYSSVEHMGILAFGLGAGASFATLFHAVNHSLTKAALFLLAGNILAVYKSKQVTDVKGVLKVLPVTGFLWLAGFFSITGTPPFGTFFSELMIFRAAYHHHPAASVLYLFFLTFIFIGMAAAFLRMSLGHASPDQPKGSDDLAMILPPALLLTLVLLFGFYLPESMAHLLNLAASQLGGF